MDVTRTLVIALVLKDRGDLARQVAAGFQHYGCQVLPVHNTEMPPVRADLVVFDPGMSSTVEKRFPTDRPGTPIKVIYSYQAEHALYDGVTAELRLNPARNAPAEVCLLAMGLILSRNLRQTSAYCRSFDDFCRDSLKPLFSKTFGGKARLALEEGGQKRVGLPSLLEPFIHYNGTVYIRLISSRKKVLILGIEHLQETSYRILFSFTSLFLEQLYRLISSHHLYEDTDPMGETRKAEVFSAGT